MNRFRHVVTAELTKIRTVRSTKWTLLLTLLLCVCLGYAVSLSLRLGYSRLPLQQRRDFDPLFATFYSLSIGQLALVGFGVTVTGSEYSTGLIVASLTAVPRRGLFYAAKITAGLAAAAGTAVFTVTATFLAAQQALGPHHAPLGTSGTVQAALGACLYLTLICAFAMGIAAISRSPAIALAILVPLLFLDSQGLGNIPGLQKVIDYLPDQAGAVIAHLSGTGEGHFSRPFGPWTGMAIMLAWAAGALICGYLVLARTDVTGTSRPGPRKRTPRQASCLCRRLIQRSAPSARPRAPAARHDSGSIPVCRQRDGHDHARPVIIGGPCPEPRKKPSDARTASRVLRAGDS